MLGNSEYQSDWRSGNEIREMLQQVYGANTVKKTAVCKWLIRFYEGIHLATSYKI
jgi:hypothetical protein